MKILKTEKEHFDDEEYFSFLSIVPKSSRNKEKDVPD